MAEQNSLIDYFGSDNDAITENNTETSAAAVGSFGANFVAPASSVRYPLADVSTSSGAAFSGLGTGNNPAAILNAVASSMNSVVPDNPDERTSSANNVDRGASSNLLLDHQVGASVNFGNPLPELLRSAPAPLPNDLVCHTRRQSDELLQHSPDSPFKPYGYSSTDQPGMYASASPGDPNYSVPPLYGDGFSTSNVDLAQSRETDITQPDLLPNPIQHAQPGYALPDVRTGIPGGENTSQFLPWPTNSLQDNSALSNVAPEPGPSASSETHHTRTELDSATDDITYQLQNMKVKSPQKRITNESPRAKFTFGSETPSPNTNSPSGSVVLPKAESKLLKLYKSQQNAVSHDRDPLFRVNGNEGVSSVLNDPQSSSHRVAVESSFQNDVSPRGTRPPASAGIQSATASNQLANSELSLPAHISSSGSVSDRQSSAPYASAEYRSRAELQVHSPHFQVRFADLNAAVNPAQPIAAVGPLRSPAPDQGRFNVNDRTSAALSQSFSGAQPQYDQNHWREYPQAGSSGMPDPRLSQSFSTDGISQHLPNRDEPSWNYDWRNQQMGAPQNVQLHRSGSFSGRSMQQQQSYPPGQTAYYPEYDRPPSQQSIRTPGADYSLLQPRPSSVQSHPQMEAFNQTFFDPRIYSQARGYYDELGNYYNQQYGPYAAAVDIASEYYNAWYRYQQYAGSRPTSRPTSRPSSRASQQSRGNTPGPEGAQSAQQQRIRTVSASERTPYGGGYSMPQPLLPSQMTHMYPPQYYAAPQYGYSRYYDPSNMWGQEASDMRSRPSAAIQRGRKTPPRYAGRHSRVSFGPGDQLVHLPESDPRLGGIPATVRIHQLSMLLPRNPDADIFPGPLQRGVTHKQDVIQFCRARSERCKSSIVLQDSESALLIWRMLMLLIKQNGNIVGTDVSELLLDGLLPLQQSNLDSHQTSEQTPMAQTPFGETVTGRFRQLLLYGHKKDALEWAMTSHLWGHALFLASKMDSRTHANVMTRFANVSMKLNDPLQTLYQLMSGRQPAAVTCAANERWGDWRPHLAMVLANPSNNPELDLRSISVLGDTLASRGLLHASHFCYLMSMQPFGLFSNKASKLVLIGSSTSDSLADFASLEAIQCTEVYEYAMQLGRKEFCIIPLQLYKLLYILMLLDLGKIQEVRQYCETVAKVILTFPGVFHYSTVFAITEIASRLCEHDVERWSRDNPGENCEALRQLNTLRSSILEGSFIPGSDEHSRQYIQHLTSSIGHQALPPAQDVKGDMVDGTISTMSLSEPVESSSLPNAAPPFSNGSNKSNQDHNPPLSYPEQLQTAITYSNQPTNVHVAASGEIRHDQTSHEVGPQEDHAVPNYLAHQPGHTADWHSPHEPPSERPDFSQHSFPVTQDAVSFDSGQKRIGTTSAYEHNEHFHFNTQPHNQPAQSGYNQTFSQINDRDENEDDDNLSPLELSQTQSTMPERRPSQGTGSRFSPYPAASPTRLRTISQSSVGSTSGRHRSGSGDSSVIANLRPTHRDHSAAPNLTQQQPPPASNLAPTTASQQQQINRIGSGGGLGKWFKSWLPGKNQMILHDDKKPTIVWDEKLNRWIDTEESEDANSGSSVPPPRDIDFKPNTVAASHAMAQPGVPPTTSMATPKMDHHPPPSISGANPFIGGLVRNKSARNMYVDPMKPTMNSGANDSPAAPKLAVFPQIQPSPAPPPLGAMFVPKIQSNSTTEAFGDSDHVQPPLLNNHEEQKIATPSTMPVSSAITAPILFNPTQFAAANSEFNPATVFGAKT